jgi:hypothetical protein
MVQNLGLRVYQRGDEEGPPRRAIDVLPIALSEGGGGVQACRVHVQVPGRTGARGRACALELRALSGGVKVEGVKCFRVSRLGFQGFKGFEIRVSRVQGFRD